MKRLLACLAVLVIAEIWLTSTYTLGHYNYVTGQVFCYARATCLHEVAHKVDTASKTQGFIDNITAYRVLMWEHPELRSEYSWDILTYPGIGSPRWIDRNPLSVTFWQGGWGGYTELYADIVRWSDGNPLKCPANLRQFFDWNLIGDEMEKLGYGR